MELWERIKGLGEFHAVDLTGVAGIARYHQEIERSGGLVARNYPRAVSLGIVLPSDILPYTDRESAGRPF